jgi:nitroreductase
MEFKELISKRYSCRKYKDMPVERERIEQCLEAARVAPSACNAQPWKFLVFDDIEKRKEIAEVAASGKYKFSKFIKEAPVLIFVLADKGSFLSKMGSLVRNTRFYLMDIGITCEHIILQAAELDLGTCYVGWFNEKAVKKHLKIPKNLEIPLLLTMGYPEDAYKLKDPVRRRAGSDNRKSIGDVAVFNEYHK